MINNWKATALGAWSMWAFYVLILLEAVPPVIEACAPWVELPVVALFIVKVIAIVAGGLLRLRRQRKLELVT